jgi:hypothetical protein
MGVFFGSVLRGWRGIGAGKVFFSFVFSASSVRSSCFGGGAQGGHVVDGAFGF